MAGEGMSNQLSNVLGVAIPYDLKRQLDIRSKKLGNENRSTHDIQYLANKSCWVRLVSSVRIKDIQYFKRYFPDLDVNDGDSLAKKFILFAGTSEYKKSQLNDNGFQYNIRSGFGANGSYGMLGNVETQLYGYKPMPGITDARIETQGKLGSIRSATINFKAWDKAQLDIIDALYFKLGYTMFLEWGHTTYFDNGDGDTYATPQLKRSDLKQIDPFAKDLKKEIIFREISTRIDESNGNYDAMLGMCTNFNFSMNEDGGYDCSIKMIALGELASQIKINQANSLPGILSSEIKELVDIYNEILRERKRQEELAAKNKVSTQEEVSTTPVELTPAETFAVQSILTLFEAGTRGLFGAFGSNPAAISEALNAIVSVEIYREVNKGMKINTGYDVIETLLNGELESDNLEGLYTTTPNQPNIDVGRAIISLPQRVKQLKIKWEPLSNNGKSYSAKKNTISIIDDGTSTPNPRPAPIATSNSPAILDAAYKKGTYDPTVDANIAQAIYDSVEGNGTNPKLFKDAIRKIANGAQYIRVNNILKTKGAEKRSIVEWVNSDFGTGFLGFGDNTQDIKDIIIILNQKFGANLAAAGYTDKIELVDDGTGKKVRTVVESNYKFIEGSFRVNQSEVDKLVNATQTTPPANTATTTAEAAEPTPQITVETVQKDEQLQYQSGLEVFIRAIQLHSFNIGYKNLGIKEGKIGTVDLYSKKSQFIKELFTNGVLSKAAVEFANSDKIKEYRNVGGETDAIKLMEKYASYGFNHNLMAQSINRQQVTITDKDSKIPQVDFKELYKSYVVPYSVNQGIAKDIDINYPVYIKFGLLLLALNHMCTIYDSKEGKVAKVTDQTPLIYIDFNPETNFCLSEPLQMSTDPLKMLIPFRGTDEEYTKLFDPKLITKDGKIRPPSGSTESKNLFKPQTEDFISSQLPEFKGLNPNAGDAYSGKIMNILLSCDYLLSLCKNFANNDQNQSVKLRPFLQQIIDDINKYLGGINLLRLAYDDKSNCLYIVDDQVQPMKLDEKSIPDTTTNSVIPVFGKYSIAKSLEIRTDISSKLSNMIAISANSDIKSDASKDGTPFGHYNDNYTDRFIPQVLSVNSSDTSKKNNIKSEPNDAEIAAATAFNEFIRCALNTGQISDSNISAATNYYIDRMNKRKGENPGTESSAMIPISVNFSTDGISGLAMGHAFLLPDEVMPASYQRRCDSDSQSIIGFVVTGLNHSLQNNAWTTEVKANMMFLKESAAFKAEKSSYNVAQLSTGNFVIVQNDGNDTDIINVEAVGGSGVKGDDFKINPTYKSIIAAAKASVGTSTAAIPGTENGNIGCGAGTSIIFLRATGKGIVPPGDLCLGTSAISSHLGKDASNWRQRSNWTEAKPGDIVVTERGSGPGHIGVVVDTLASDGSYTIISNSSGGFRGTNKGTIQPNYTLKKWASVASRNPSRTFAYEYIGSFT